MCLCNELHTYIALAVLLHKWDYDDEPSWLCLGIFAGMNMEMLKSRPECRKKLTLHADFVLSGARVRDEIHLHRHLPHRSVGWLTWTHTKTATGELERGVTNIRENGGEVDREPGREIEWSETEMRERERIKGQSPTLWVQLCWRWNPHPKHCAE